MYELDFQHPCTHNGPNSGDHDIIINIFERLWSNFLLYLRLNTDVKVENVGMLCIIYP